MKGVLIHALLAVTGLVMAYTTWTREDEVEEPGGGQVTIVDCTPEQMTRVSLESPTNKIDITPQKRGEDTLYWVVNQRIPPKPKEPKKPTQAKPAADGGVADAGAKAAPEAKAAEKPKKPEKPPPKPTRFLAKKAYLDYLKTVAPLRAERALGVIEKARFADFGFDTVGTYVRLECAGKTTELEIGGRTYGTAKRYARNPKTGEAYLLDKAIVQDLRSARYKFMRTELHDFGPNGTDEAVVSAEGETRTLLHRNRKLVKQASWVDAAAPDQRNELFSNWFSRVKTLKIREYLPDGAAPGSDIDLEKGAIGEVFTVVEIAYSLDGKPLGKLELAGVEQGDATFYYARSEATHNWVAVFTSAAKQVAGDVREVVGGDAPMPLAPESSEEPKSPPADKP